MSVTPKVIELNEEVEGDQIGTRNYRFCKLGESVPIKPSDSDFSPDSPPSRPLAISQRFRLLFLAHSQGFCVSRIGEVKALAKKLKDGDGSGSGSGGSVQEVSVVDVGVGKVEILALSRDESVLGVVVGHCVHFYAVSALLHKEQKPSYSVSADDSSYIIDMRWDQLSVKEYVVLSHNGKLHQGCGQSPLKDIMDNVDAVEWSEKGDCVAVAKKNVLTIFSSEFKEKHSFLLSFKSVLGDSDVNSLIKVNCIRWVRSDCIMVGCLQLNDEGEEENYLVQVITNEGGHIDDASSISTVLSFYDIFLDYQVDVVPRASGPHLLMQYFDRQQLAFVANRKNLTQHIILFGWGMSGRRNEASVIDIENDAWTPHIELQGNGDDNIILGLSIYQLFENDEVSYVLGDEETEVPPCCNLLCLTIDGKLSVFDFASAVDASDSVENSDSHEEDDATLEVPSRQLSTEISTVHEDSEADTPATVGTHTSSRNELVSTEVAKAAIPDQSSALLNQGNEPLKYNQMLKGYEEPSSTQTTQNQDRDVYQTSFARMQATNELKSTETVKAAIPDQSSSLFNQEKKPLQYHQSPKGYTEQSFARMAQTQDRFGHKTSFADLQVKSVDQASPETVSEAKSSTSFSSREFFKDGPRPATGKMSQIGHRAELPNNMVTTDGSSGSFFTSSSAFASPHQDPSYFKKADSSPVNSSGRMLTSGAVNIRSPAAVTQVPPQQKFASGSFSIDPQKTNPTLSSTRVQTSKANSSKQSQNIEEMVKKLDSLYENIEGKGGFVEASIACQERSVVALEEKIQAASRRCRDWKVTVDEQISEMQDLLDKTVQVLSRKIYMEGIFKQACDTRYWDLWNRQKLSSELELKRRHIDEANKELTTQLIELERHFNILELNRFGDSGGLQNRSTLRKSHGQSRHIQSLRSLHTTTDAQLVAAEQLSENLSNQMAVLNIESPAKKQTIKKELFDTIGLSYDTSSYSSPGKEKIPATPLNKQLLSTTSVDTIEQTRRHRNSLSKTHEPETARRRRDSLDQNWVNVAPPRTTVKRIVLHGDQEGQQGSRSPFPLDRKHVSTPLSRGTADARSKSSLFPQNHLKGNGIPDIRDQYSNRSPASTLANWGIRAPSTKVSEVSSQTALLSTSAGQTRAEIAGLTNEKSGHVFPARSTGSFMFSESNAVNQSGHNLDGSQFSYPRFPVQTLPITKTVTETSNNNNSLSYTKGSDLVGQISSFPATSSSKVPSSPASNVHSDSQISGKVCDVTSKNQSQDVEPALPDSSSLTARDFPPAQLISPPKQSELPLFREDNFLSKTSVAANQKTAESQSISFPTTFLFLTPTSTAVSSTSVGQPTEMLSSNSFTPMAKTSLVSEPAESGRIDTSQTLLESGSIRTVDSSADVSGSEKDEVSATETPSANIKGNDVITIAAIQKSELPAIAGSEKMSSEVPPVVFDQGTSLKSDCEVNLGGTVNPTSDMLSNAKAATTNNMGIPSNFGSFNSSNNAISHVLIQEDEMEEEAPETSQVTDLSSGFLRGFGSGSSPNPNSDHAKPNPFGLQMTNSTPPPSSTFTMPASGGELFRPPSFNFSSLQPAQPPQSTGFGAFTGGFSGGGAMQSSASGFGKPAQIGSGQQALGSVLGSFGQSRQLGAGLPGTGLASPGGFGGSSGGFGNGFGGASSTNSGGGFAAAATAPGGFAAAATAPGGFAAAATAPVGFAAAAATGGGFASPNSGAPFSGGFGGFGGQQGGGFGGQQGGAFGGQQGGGFGGQQGGGFGGQQGGGFSVFSGSSPGTGKPPSELLTQMRK